MVFITAGMGGGTGTGAAPVIAKVAKELGLLTVGIVTIPFRFEGQRRIDQAIEGIKELNEHVDSLLVINNEKLREISGDLRVSEAFAKADNILTVAAKGIAEIITVNGYINVDFADVQTVMTDSGVALMGSGYAEGPDRALHAIQDALHSPLLNNNDIKGARNILLNITSGNDEATMDEISQINDYVQQSAGYTADLIWGNTRDPKLGEKIGVTVIATGFETDIIPEIYAGKKRNKTVVALDDKTTPVVEPKSTKRVFTLDEPANDPISDDEMYFPTTKNDFQKKTSGEIYASSVQVKDVVAQEETPVVDEPKNAQRRAQDTQRDPKQVPSLLKDNIDTIENVPAYKRKNLLLESKKYSAQQNVSKFSLTEDENNNPVLRSDNAYLHDRVD